MRQINAAVPALNVNVADLQAALNTALAMIRLGRPRQEAVDYLTNALRALYAARDRGTVTIP